MRQIQMARRVADFGTTIFSEINQLAAKHQAVNLGQGAPDFDGPPPVLAAAIEAVNNSFNQYAPGLGHLQTRQAIADHAQRFYRQVVDPIHEVVVTAGATEALCAAIWGLTDVGDEVIVFEPVYDSYVPNMRMAGVTPQYIPLRAPTWAFDPDELRAAFNDRTRIIMINTPHNPTGKVFTHAELTFIAELCQHYNVVAIVDEVYEHLLYDGVQHIRMATLPGMQDRTLTISSLGKTFSVTGWKIGWAIGPHELVTGVNRAHQFITYAVASPLQLAAAQALALPDAFFEQLKITFQAKRDYMLGSLQEIGFETYTPSGGYFIIADWQQVAPAHVENDVQFAHWLTSEIGVACIPPSAFYQPADQHLAHHLTRISICKQDTTLQAAAQRLARLIR